MISRFHYAEAISRIRNPQDWSDEKTDLMVAACREMAEFHARHCPEVGALYRRRGFDPYSLRTEQDLLRIPMIGVSAMKQFLLLSLPDFEAVLKLTSSGTRGQKTQIWFDAASLDRVQAMLANQWEQEGLVSHALTNYLMFVYDPADAQDLGIAFSDKNQQRFAPASKTFYAVKKDASGEWRFRRDEVIQTLREFAAEGKPVRLFGIPSFFQETLESMSSPIFLPKGSWMVTGGGWKAAEDKKITREEFRERASWLFGIPRENIRDGYGMAEHSAPYIDCSRHKFHIPAYNRIIARDPMTLEALPPGEAGLLELITPFNAMMPNLAILSTDMGMIDKEHCGCGRRSPTFTLLGRGGLTKHKGCAIHAAEIVKRD